MRPRFKDAASKRFWERVMRHDLTDTFRELLRIFAHPFDHYRPELHYMRGPGPKCRAKNAAPSVAPMAENLAAEATA